MKIQTVTCNCDIVCQNFTLHLVIAFLFLIISSLYFTIEFFFAIESLLYAIANVYLTIVTISCNGTL